ncbi:MAG: ASKHA domain-containing protein [Candidatus Nanopelagicaceae bacterium]
MKRQKLFQHQELKIAKKELPTSTLPEHDGTGRVKIAFRSLEKDGTASTERTITVPTGVSAFDAASWNGIAIDSTCGGYGTCKKCKVKITVGDVPISPLDNRAFSATELTQGWRLACLVRTVSNVSIDVPPLTTRPKAATVGVGRQVILRPAVQKRYVELDEPTLHDQRTDIVRLLDAIDDIEATVSLAAIRSLPQTLRSSDFKVTAVFIDQALIDVEPGDTTSIRYGVAYDLGTTTVVATLLDLNTGTPLAVRSMLNKQQPFGADVISRISATMLDPLALDRLRSLAQATLSELTNEVCEDAGINPLHVYEVALAGNATMTQLVLGINPEPIGVAPFIMVSADYPDVEASELGISIHPGAKAVILPSLGAYVGGDIVAGALASGMDRDKRLRLFIDVGTNCEIILGNGEKILATAAPAGPAFEAASIRCGVRAASGAIETIKVEDGDLVIGTIEDAPPIGICGSGLVDACACLVQVGLLDHSGRFATDEVAASVAPKLAPRLLQKEGERIFVLTWNGEVGDLNDCVYLTQRDVRELQFAKAAIATGWALLLEEFGVEPSEIQQVLLAGSFGSYLSPASAIKIGLVPKLSVLRIVSAGNVAGEGAKMTLLSAQERHGANALLQEIEYVELSDRADFNDKFVERLAFPS